MNDTANLTAIRASVVERIRAALDQSGLTVAQLAQASGVSKATIHRALEEDGKFVPSMATLGRIEAAVNAPADSLPGRVAERMRAINTNPNRLAEDAGLGRDYVRDIQRGKVKAPSAEKLSALADALGTTADYLMGRADDPGGAPSVGSPLRDAREAAGFATATDAARRFGWAPSTYMGHENGTRGLRKEAAETYAAAFGVSWPWLMGGEDVAPVVGSRTQMREAGSDANRNGWMAGPDPITAPIRMTVSADGSAHLRMDMKLPLDVAVQILALVQGGSDA